MPRAFRSKIAVELNTSGGWVDWKGGFKSVPDAEKWIRENIEQYQQLRIVKISGVFNAKTTVIKR